MATDPICGMFVDERAAELTLTRQNRTYFFCSTACLAQFAQPERELGRLRRRLAVAWPFSVVVVALTYLAPFPGWPWLALVLAGTVQCYAGAAFYRGLFEAVRARVWNMDVLISVGTTAAFGYSVAVLVVGSLARAYYFDASSLIVTLILTGNYLEYRVRDRARGTLRRLAEMLPPVAVRVDRASEVEVPLAEIRSGDRLRVRPGARFPTDGRVRSGRTFVDESLVTGESGRVAKAPGDRIIGGTVNGEGAVVVEATDVGSDTFLAHVAQLVAEAETSRVPLQRLADRIAAVFVPVVLVLAVLGAFAWFFTAGADLGLAVLVFVSVVITACPCAFGIATPAAIVVGTGRAADEGILYKGADSIERASRVDLVLSDKTGTLTRGTPTLTDVLPAPGVPAEELLRTAARLEQGSDHPFARAIRAEADRRGLSGPAFEEVTVDPGRGIMGRDGPHRLELVAGSAATFEDLGRAYAETTRRLAADGKSWSVLARDGRLLGILGFSDEIAPGAREAIAALHHDGIEVVMVTGDHAAAARRVADRLGIRQVHSGLSPEGKLRLLERYRVEGHFVAFVGDGINDAPALTRADLGIAIAAGADVAREAGGVVLVRSGFSGVALALRIARRTVRKVRGNLAWALGYNAVLLPIALGALVPLFGEGVFRLLPITGAVAMALSSTLVVLNSYSLRWVDLDDPPPRRAPPRRSGDGSAVAAGVG